MTGFGQSLSLSSQVCKVPFHRLPELDNDSRAIILEMHGYLGYLRYYAIDHGCTN